MFHQRLRFQTCSPVRRPAGCRTTEPAATGEELSASDIVPEWRHGGACTLAGTFGYETVPEGLRGKAVEGRDPEQASKASDTLIAYADSMFVRLETAIEPHLLDASLR